MNKLDLNSLTKEQIAMAMECETPEELIALAKEAGVELTLEQAKAYLEELQDVELDPEALENVAGGKFIGGSFTSDACAKHGQAY